MEPNLPDILAIDPRGCVCSQCLVGVRVTEDIWLARANGADIARLTTGLVWHTAHATTRYRFLMENEHNLGDADAQAYVRCLREAVEDDLDLLLERATHRTDEYIEL